MATLFLDPHSYRIMYFSWSGDDPIPSDIVVISNDGKRALSPVELRAVDVPDSMLPVGLHALNCSSYHYLTSESDNGNACAQPMAIERVEKAKTSCSAVESPAPPCDLSEDSSPRFAFRLNGRAATESIAAQIRCMQAQAALRGESPELYPIVAARAQARHIAVLRAATEILEEVEAIYGRISDAETAAELASAGGAE
jgi:hypothetical protein